jgi:hypothetical protein
MSPTRAVHPDPYIPSRRGKGRGPRPRKADGEISTKDAFGKKLFLPE